MLHRQRLILSMLASAGGEASHLELTKWAFLIREETPWGRSDAASTFYTFVPYQFGPFSFGLYQEVAALIRDGLVVDISGDHWQLTSRGATEASRSEVAAAQAARSVVERFHGKPVDTLVNHVYDRHPWYTVNSRIRRNATRPSASPAVYAAGYEGLLVDAFLDGLLRNGMERLIDVRRNPIARRYGFHKSTLGRLCGKLGIDYQHVPELGIASEQRQNLDETGARARLFETYRATTLQTQKDAIQRVARWMREKPSVLVCLEAKPCDCHRSHLAQTIVSRTGLAIKHLDIHR